MPIITLQDRNRELGRIRLGNRSEKGFPQKLKTFRLTSFDQKILQEAANRYGGEVKACTTPDLKGQFEVITKTNVLPIYVAPMLPSQWLENWNGGTCKRRCDGEQEMLTGRPCLCKIGDEMICKPTTRLAVILYELPGIGVWRLESHGWNAASELAQAAKMLLDLLGRSGMPLPVRLRMEERADKYEEGGQTKTARFMVPVIDVDYSPSELALMAEEAKALSARNDERDALKPPNPRGRYFAMHSEAGLPDHSVPHVEQKAINYRVWSKLLGRPIQSGADLNEEDWKTLVFHLIEISEDREEEPEEWSRWRENSHPVQRNLPVASALGNGNSG